MPWTYSNTEAGYNAYWLRDDDARLFRYLLKLSDQGHALAVSGVEQHNGKRCPLIDLLQQAGWQTNRLKADYNVVSKVGLKQTDEVVLTNYLQRESEILLPQPAPTRTGSVCPSWSRPFNACARPEQPELPQV